VAGEQVLPTVNPGKTVLQHHPDSRPLRIQLPLPSPYQAVDLPVLKPFRSGVPSRGRSILEKIARGILRTRDAPMLHGTTGVAAIVGLPMRDRVRVVTCGRPAAAAFPCKRGRKGDPSLQWTSRLMNRGGRPARTVCLNQGVFSRRGGVPHHLTPRAGAHDAFGKSSSPWSHFSRKPSCPFAACHGERLAISHSKSGHFMPQFPVRSR